MPDRRYVPEARERLKGAALMLSSLAGLLGQADDIDACGRDGIAALLDLLAEQVEAATADLSRQPSG